MKKVLEEFLTRYGEKKYTQYELNDLKNDLVIELTNYKKEAKGVDVVLVSKLIPKVQKQKTKEDLFMLVTETIFQDN